MFNRVAKILGDSQGIDSNKIKLDSHLINDLCLNSLDVIELMCIFEEELGVEIPDECISELRIVGDIVEYFEKNI